ncbi:MAG TPA: DinB family protein [Bacillota bacterium]|nr:DinB family protein [Bacillota bacterium]
MDLNAVARRATWRAVEAVDSAALSRTPAGGGWSVLQVLEHLHLMDSINVTRFREAAPLAEPPAPDLSTALNLGSRLNAPAPTQPQGAFATLDDARRAMAASHAALRQAFAEAESEGRADTHGSVHPVFGPITIRQRFEVIALHELRHLYQIYRILGSA